MVTPHINAPDDAFAASVLMPGDPRRAQYIAENHLDGAELVCDVRAMTGYTGTWKGQPVSVMGSGMGIPSAAIYITELFRFYGVQRIIRVGTTGAYSPDLALRSMVVASEAVTNSNLPELIGAPAELRPTPSLVAAAQAAASAAGRDLTLGKVFTSDIFYEPDDSMMVEHSANGVVCVEMETAGLYAIAAVEGAEALSLLTVSDHLVHSEHLSSEERQETVDEMIEIGLAVAIGA